MRTEVDARRVVVNVRGTCGSGKSTAARQLITALDGQPMVDETNGKVWAYNLRDRVFVVGSYEAVRAGADGLPMDEIYVRIRRLATRGSVVFESLFVSGFYGKFRQLEDELKPTHRWIWACLDTPLETCLERARQRRSQRSSAKPFNPAGIQRLFRAVITTRRTLEREGRDVRILNHQNTLVTLLDWLGERNVAKREQAA